MHAPDVQGSWVVSCEHVRGDTRAQPVAGLLERVRAARAVVVAPRTEGPGDVRAALAVPVRGADGALAAVLELASASPFIDEPTIAALGRITAAQIEDDARREALVAETERLRLICDGQPCAVGLLDPGGRFVAVNRALCELSGHTAAELVGRAFADLVRAPVRPAPSGLGLVEESPGAPEIPRQIVVRLDGTRLPVEVEHAVVRSEIEGVDLQVVHLRDDRRDERLREDQAAAGREFQRQALLFNHILEHLQSAVIVANPRGEFILLNRAGRALARPPTPGSAPSLSDAKNRVFEADGVTPVRVEDTVMARTLRGEAAAEKLVVIRDENHPEGTWVLSTGRPLLDDGKMIGAVVLAYDVTALKREEGRSRGLLEAAPDAIVITDSAGSIVQVNSQAEAMFGYPRAELVGRPVEHLIPERLRARHPAHRAGYAADPRVREMGTGLDLVAQHRDGREFPVEVSLSPLAVSGGRLTIAAVRDVTRQKQIMRELERSNEALRRAETELRRSNAELDEFAFAASHDLRAPLRAIRSLVGFLEEDIGPGIPAASREHFALLQSRVKRMDTLLVSLLEYSRIGRSAEQVAAVRLATVVQRAIELAGAPASFVVTHEYPEVTLSTVQVLLERVLLNLLTNAVKHHDRKDGRITIGGVDRGTILELWVQDDGPGIAPEYHERIFGLFQTLKPRDEVEGSGMGLGLVRKMVARAGGAVRVESSGRGARFTFTWPKEWPR